MSALSLRDRLNSLFHRLPLPGADEGVLDDAGRARPVDPTFARRMLVREQKQIAQELDEAFQSYDGRLAKLAKEIYAFDDGAILDTWDNLREEQGALLRVIRRLAVAELDSRSLLNEWNEWRIQEESQLTSSQLERKEMLRSEIVIRGERLPEETCQDHAASDVHAESLIPTSTVSGHLIAIERSEPDGFEEWDSVFTNGTDDTTGFWEQELRTALAAEAFDAKSVYPIVERLRDAHAKQRLIDRSRGVRRFRLGAFRQGELDTDAI